MNARDKKPLWRKLAAAAVWIAIWQGVYMAVGNELLIVSPVAVAVRLYELCGTADFWASVGLSIARIFAGFLAAVIAGTALGFATSFIPLVDDLFRPILRMVRATPVASFIILAFVWMATGVIPVFTAFLMVLPVVEGNISAGLRAVDPKLLEAARVFRFSGAKRFSRLYLPSVMPYMVAAVTTGTGLAWKAGIAAEVLCTPALSIGKQLYSAKVYLETADLFAVTAVIIVISVILERLMVMAIRAAGSRFNAEEA